MPEKWPTPFDLWKHELYSQWEATPFWGAFAVGTRMKLLRCLFFSGTSCDDSELLLRAIETECLAGLLQMARKEAEAKAMRPSAN